MAEFFIETAPQTSGTHLIHFSTCHALPQQDQLRYLGSIAAYDSAFVEGKKIYNEVNACTECAAKYATA